MSATFSERVTRALARAVRLPMDTPHIPSALGPGARLVKPSHRWLQRKRLQIWASVLGAYAFTGGMIATGYALSTTNPDHALSVLGILDMASFGVGDTLVTIAPLFLALGASAVLTLQYLQTWYVISDNALLVRSGVFTSKETTITFGNVQNVEIARSPVDRLFRISAVDVQTAGGGKASARSKKARKAGAVHSDGRGARLQGIEDPESLRTLLLTRSNAGSPSSARHRWTGSHVGALRAIRDEARALGVATPGGRSYP